ncbi:hypothetical protein DIPPA_12161 [Diplonema papillatum]|nr:hypothetical protein DIPPA_12161 [Diplonema papillatum]
MREAQDDAVRDVQDDRGMLHTADACLQHDMPVCGVGGKETEARAFAPGDADAGCDHRPKAPQGKRRMPAPIPPSRTPKTRRRH